ncbi:MAG: MlaD family protein, partial [Luminiphilus sp.]
MQEKTAHTLLGAFILSALAIAVVATLLVAGRGYDAANSQTVIMVFDGSVYGLNKGAPVAIRGANIGQVTDIRVRLQHADELRLWMEVEAVINRAAVAAVADGDATLGPELINSGLRAQLNNSSF